MRATLTIHGDDVEIEIDLEIEQFSADTFCAPVSPKERVPHNLSLSARRAMLNDDDLRNIARIGGCTV